MKDLSFTVPPEYSGAQVKNFLRRGCGVSAKLLSQCKKMQNGILKNGSLFGRRIRRQPGTRCA